MKFLAALRLILTLRCEQSTRIVSDSLDMQLSFAERWAVRLHAIGCWSCRRFRRQLLLIRDAARARGESHDLEKWPVEGLSDDARLRILKAIRRSQGDES